MADVPEKIRQNLGKQATEEEMRGLARILLKKQVAKDNVTVAKFPEGTSPTVISAFYEAAMKVFADAQFDEDEWWRAVITKHGFRGIPVFLDNSNGELYTELPAAAPPPPPVVE